MNVESWAFRRTQGGYKLQINTSIQHLHHVLCIHNAHKLIIAYLQSIITRYVSMYRENISQLKDSQKIILKNAYTHYIIYKAIHFMG